MKKSLELTDIEYNIVEDYLENQISIRSISEKYSEYGRTKIKNIIDKFASINEENANRVALALQSQKQHKEVTVIEEQEELSEEQIEYAYKSITIQRKTLTAVASELKKNRETVKNAIFEYLGEDKVSVSEFKKILKENQNSSNKVVLWNELSDEEKEKLIIKRLNDRREISNKNPYSEETLHKKSNRLIKFFEKRNAKLSEDEKTATISKEQLFKMMYDYPTMLSMSLSNKIKPILHALDNNKDLGKANTSAILRENPAVLGASLERTKLQVKILKDSETMQFALRKPRIFRTSPELMYAQIKLWQAEKKYSNPFLSTKKMFDLYGKTVEDIQKAYPVEEKYGDDEYFDRM